jgi:ribosomal protein L40E
MLCPKCNAEIPDDATICPKCSSTLTENKEKQTEPKAKQSLLAILSALLAGLAAFMSIFAHPLLAFTIALLGFISAVASIKQIKHSKRKIIGKTLAVAVCIFIAVHMLFIGYWRIDAPPIIDDYFIDHVRSAPTEYQQSYELLNSIADINEHIEGSPAIGFSIEDINNLDEIYKMLKAKNGDETLVFLKDNSQKIHLLWNHSEKGRIVINKLNDTPEIADLMEPWLDSDIPYVKNFRDIVHLYRIYASLQSINDNELIAIDELNKLNNVTKKISINARSLVSKLVCYACFSLNIRTANFILNNSQLSQDSTLLLSDYFSPISKETLSLRNPIIFEYLTCKNELGKIYNNTKIKYSHIPLLKYNSTLRFYKNQCERWLAFDENLKNFEKISVWPSIYPQIPVELDQNDKCPWYYSLYNPIGSNLISILIPAIDRILVIKTRTEIYDDLLQIVLNLRLGREVNLKARAYSDEYIIDIENKKILSPGPDGEVNTEDDIFLPINPQVLNLTE